MDTSTGTPLRCVGLYFGSSLSSRTLVAFKAFKRSSKLLSSAISLVRHVIILSSVYMQCNACGAGGYTLGETFTPTSNA
jgi:hypothetical protein